jgi:hypothetical protein
MATVHRARVIAGFGRSGTTWIQDVVAQANRLRAVFEPLHSQLISGAQGHAHRYLSASDESDELYRLLHRFFYEDYLSLWSDYRIVKNRLLPKSEDLVSWRKFKAWLHFISNSKNNVVRYHWQRRYKERIVKFVRANMMLTWLQEKFDARIVFVIRHPAAVVLSQMRALPAWSLDDRINIYRNDKQLLAVLDDNAKQLLFESLEPVESLTLSWCIENSVALRQANAGAIHVVYYENLLQDGKREWTKLLSALDLHVMPDESLIYRPSQQAWGEKATDARLVRQYDLWMNNIDALTASKMQAILDKTGMNKYRISEALPQSTNN